MDIFSFARYHVHGNNFVVVMLTPKARASFEETFADGIVTQAHVARLMCSRSTGFHEDTEWSRGADGLITGEVRGPGEPLRMHLLNSDGSYAETSGNGLACMALAAVHTGNVPPGEMRIETDAGVQRCIVGNVTGTGKANTKLQRTDYPARAVSVEMNAVTDGPPISDALLAQIEADLGGNLRNVGAGSVGNPHLVIALAEPIDAGRARKLGKAYEQSFASTPIGSEHGGINVEFVWASDPGAIAMRVWERGAGLTQACGSGAVVAATLAHRWGMTPSEAVSVIHPAWPKEEPWCSVHLGPPPMLGVTPELIDGYPSVESWQSAK